MSFSLFVHPKQGQKIDGQGDIVVGAKTRQPISPWRKTYIVGCVTVIIASCIASYFLWGANSRAHRAKFVSEGAVQNGVLQEAARDDHAQQYGQEAAVLKHYLATNPPEQYRYKPLMILGTLAYDKRDDAGALNYYQQAVTDNGGQLTEFDAETLGQAAAAAGNKAMALQYFKKALQLTEANPNAGGSLEDLKATVKHLESTQ